MWWRTSNCSSLLIYRPERRKGWVGLVGWPIADKPTTSSLETITQYLTDNPSSMAYQSELEGTLHTGCLDITVTNISSKCIAKEDTQSESLENVFFKHTNKVVDKSIIFTKLWLKCETLNGKRCITVHCLHTCYVVFTNDVMFTLCCP